MPGSQPGRFLFFAYRSACQPSSLPPSSQFLLSPRTTRPLRSSGMISSTNPGAAANFIEWIFLWSRLSKWQRARELKHLLFLWSCGCLEMLPGLSESRREIEQHVGSPYEAENYPALAASALQSLSLSSAAAPRLLHIQGTIAFPWNSFFSGNNFSVITGVVKIERCCT